MNDTDDHEVDMENQELLIKDNMSDKEYSANRHIRAEIEKIKELKELKRLTEDSYNDFVFD